MQNNFKKMPFFLSVVILSLLVLAFLFLYKQVNSKNKKTQDSMMEIENEVNRRNEVKSLNQSLESIKADKVELETHFAKSSDIVPFLNTIEALAPQVGAKAEVASVDILKDNTGLLVQINSSGNFDNLYKFFTLLENSPYELEFVNLDMQMQNEGQTLEESGESPIAEWRAVIELKLLTFVQ